MRPTTLLLLIVALLLLTAPAASYAQSITSLNLSAPFTGDSGAILRADGSNALASDEARGLRTFDTGNSHVTCLTMRTYVVARESRTSDSTHTVGYHECVPAWKFDMRSTEQKMRSPQAAPEKR